MKKVAMCLFLIYVSTSIVHGDVDFSPCGDDDWIPYEDEKCVKLFQTFVTRYQAEEVCSEQVSDGTASSLLTIKSAAEQNFLNEYIFNSSKFNNVWIGAYRRLDSTTEFDWINGEPVERFTNWAIGSPSDNVERRCVHLKSQYTREISDFEWVDVSCSLGNWFICQKLQSWSIQQFQQALLSVRREMQHSVDDLKDHILALEQNPVPIGFIYVQLSGQPEPRTTWPTVTWTEITSTYAGLFFRAAGGGSAGFGTTQAEGSPRLNRVHRVTSGTIHTSTTVTANNVASPAVISGASSLGFLWGLSFTVSNAEVRPRNQAIRIWKRSS